MLSHNLRDGGSGQKQAKPDEPGAAQRLAGDTGMEQGAEPRSARASSTSGAMTVSATAATKSSRASTRSHRGSSRIRCGVSMLRLTWCGCYTQGAA
jgi:hypothetical protein